MMVADIRCYYNCFFIGGVDRKSMGKHTKKTRSACNLLAFVFFFAIVITFSANFWASLAFGHVVIIDSCVKREVTRLRRRACRCEDFLPRWRCLRWPPAMAAVWNDDSGGESQIKILNQQCKVQLVHNRDS